MNNIEITESNITLTSFASHTQSVGKQEEMSLGQFLEKLRHPVVGVEALEEFKALSKEEQVKLKDAGAYLAGTAKDNRRLKNCIEDITAIVLDVDDATPSTLETVLAKASMYLIVHSTRKHCPEDPRYRIIVPLATPIPVVQREAIARKIALDLGVLNECDPASFRQAQIMFWPSVCKDAEYILVESNFTNLLNPNDVLASYNNWENIQEWPYAEAEKKVFEKKKRACNATKSDGNIASVEAEDPRNKPSYVGAFCRAYTVTEAMAKYIPGVYEEGTQPGRFTYSKGSSSDGLVVFNDLHAYSHHATDPISGKFVNAYDFVRLHLFDKLDTEADDGTPVFRLPSVIAMNEMLSNDSRVKAELININDDTDLFEDFEYPEEDYDLPLQDNTSHQEESESNDFKKVLAGKLKVDANGKIAAKPENYLQIMRYDPKFKGIAYNVLSQRIEYKGVNPWTKKQDKPLTDADISCILTDISHRYNIYNNTAFDDALWVVASERNFNPVVYYLNNLPPWDGVQRADTLLIDFLGAEDNEYVRMATRVTLIGGVARAYKPGCKFDTVLITVGKQGLGKSTLWRVLAEGFFSDSISLKDMEDVKKAYEKMAGHWCLEIPEMTGMSKSDQVAIKAFITSQEDTFRAAYARIPESHPRMCFFVGTTNEESGFLRDPSGGRRFLPIKVKGGTTERNPFTLTAEYVAQIWAEAKHYYDEGHSLILTDVAAKMALNAQSAALVHDERAGIVQQYLDKELPTNWPELNLDARRTFLNGGINWDYNFDPERFTRTTVSNVEIACECFGYQCGKVDRRVVNEISMMMTSMEGWERADKQLRIPIYGKQNIYRRVEST